MPAAITALDFSSPEARPLFFEEGAGAAGVDLLGHDTRSLDHPGHRHLLATVVRRLLEARP